MAEIDREWLLKELLELERRMDVLVDSMHDLVATSKETNRQIAEGRERIEKLKKLSLAEAQARFEPHP
ncbi:hypothetical protein ATN84_08855 [Paramesorhizobium deserti]|uniref:Uncharacterized protein n=1 Tax=Paramesorhizobium deserti TaxID=1494590 RepID=A0A135HW96_9HYPH|nr:hypothetical protein [Paramesorhizobium deserti]KXF77473.1 hypothetical protein ATN84_08855 [Paramesorhizobium deserti]